MRMPRFALTIALSLSLSLSGCADVGDETDETDAGDTDVQAATATLVPTSDVGSYQVVGVGDTTRLYRNVDDGAGAADDAATHVRTATGAASGSHRTGYSGGPAGTVTAATVTYRADRGTAQGTAQVELYDGTTLLARGKVVTLGAWTTYTDDFTGLSVASADALRTRVVLRNTTGAGSLRYTQIHLRVSTGVAAPTRSPAGAWAIRQVHSVSELDAATRQIETALATPGIAGFGLRIPVDTLLPSQGQFDPTILDRGLALARKHGLLFKPRIIWGKYTPTWARGPVFQDGNGSAPIPFTSTGAPNAAFETAYAFVLEREAAWAATRPDVVMLDCGWYSLNYSELYFGPGVQGAYGASTATNQARFIEAHRRLIDIAHSIASEHGIPVGFGLSGHGPIGSISPALATHMEGLGPDSPLVFMQANGWGPGGEWGGALESTLDQGVWPKDVRRAVQDISPQSCRTAASWRSMFTAADTLATTYVELYTYQWALGAMNCDQAAFDEMKRQIGLYEPAP